MDTNRKTWTLVAFMALAAILPAAAVGVADPLSGGIGFRHDGSGIFPSDCRPPTKFDGITGENLVWKVPLPNHSNSSPIVVGAKAFVVCAAGWPEGQDCALLLCFDAQTGKELWRRDLDEFATQPETQASQARQVRAEYYRRIRRLNNLMFEYQSADDTRKAAILKEAAQLGAMKEESFERYSIGSAEACLYHDRAFADKLRKICGYAPITWAPTCLDINMPTPVSDGKRIYIYTGRRVIYAFDLDGNKQWQVWQSDAPYNYHYPEDLANSPMIVDGLLLMYCFDHLWAYDPATGQCKYRTESRIPSRHAMGQPVLLRLPRDGGQPETAIFLWTGDLVRVRDGKILCASVARVSCASLSSDGVDRVFLGVSGGGAEAKGAPRQWLFTTDDESGAMGIRFTLKGDAATAEKLWYNPKGAGYKVLSAYPIFRDEKLWIDSAFVVDALTGKAMFQPKQRADLAYNGIIAAGGHIYGLQKSQINAGSGGAGGLGLARELKLYCTVSKMGHDRLAPPQLCAVEALPAQITEPARKAQVIAMTSRARYQDWYGWHEAYSAPFASGNRLFVRTFDALYCFGDKSQPFAASKAFEEVRP